MTASRLIRRKCAISPRFHQVDMMKVVHNAQYFFWFEEGRLQIASEVLPFEEAVRRGVVMPVIHNACHYKHSVRFGDELVLHTTHRIQSEYEGRLEFEHSLVNIATKVEAASGVTVTTLMNINSNQLIKHWPDDLWQRYQALK